MYKVGMLYINIENGTEYLYLGRISIILRHFSQDEEKLRMYEVTDDEVKFAYQKPKHYFLVMTNRLKELAMNYETMQVFVDDVFLTLDREGKSVFEGVLESKALKDAIEEKEMLFTNNEMKDHIIQGRYKEALGFRLICRIRPFGKK